MGDLYLRWYLKKLFFSMLLIAASLFPQVTSIIKHHSYTTLFSKPLKYSVEVELKLTKTMLDSPERTGCAKSFISDPVVHVITISVIGLQIR